MNKLGGDAVIEDSGGSKIGAEVSAFSETVSGGKHLNLIRGQPLQPMQGLQEFPMDMGAETSVMDNTGALSRIDTDDLLDGTVEGALTNAQGGGGQGASKYSWRKAVTEVKMRSSLNAVTHSSTGASEPAEKPSAAQVQPSKGELGMEGGHVRHPDSDAGGLEASPPQSEASTLGGSSFVAAIGLGGNHGSRNRVGGSANGVKDAELLDDDLTLPQTQGCASQMLMCLFLSGFFFQGFVKSNSLYASTPCVIPTVQFSILLVKYSLRFWRLQLASIRLEKLIEQL
jgi:hypothetical protein